MFPKIGERMASDKNRSSGSGIAVFLRSWKRNGSGPASPGGCRAFFLGFLAVGLGLSFVRPVYPKDMNFEVTVESDRAVVGQPLQLFLTFNGVKSIPKPPLPDLDGFEERYQGPSAQVSVVNGQVSSSVTHIFLLLPTKPGKFQIGPFDFQLEQDRFVSNAVTVEVGDPQAAAAAGLPSAGASGAPASPGGIGDRIFLTLEAPKEKAYLNEVLAVTVRLYVMGIGARDVQYPEFAHEGLSKGEFARPRQYQQSVNGRLYNVVEFQAPLFGLRPGVFQIGPASLKLNLLIPRQERGRVPTGWEQIFDRGFFPDFFGGYELYPYEAKAAALTLTVLDLPAEGRPQDFTGAVGDFRFRATASPAQVPVGDPVTLKAIVEGQGNFMPVAAPRLGSQEGFKVYDPQVTQEPQRKVFEQVIMPQNERVDRVPALVFSFFDPAAGAYRTLTQGPFPLKVTASADVSRVVGSTAPAAAGGRQESFGRDIVYIKESLGSLSPAPGGIWTGSFPWLVQVVPPLSFLIFAFLRARSRKLESDVRFARRLRAPRQARQGLQKAGKLLREGQAAAFYDSVFLVLRDYLGDRFHLPSQAITVSVIDEVIAPRGVGTETLADLKEIFTDCDTARYAPAAISSSRMKDVYEKLRRVIDTFERGKF
jgi:hypothetical protein